MTTGLIVLAVVVLGLAVLFLFMRKSFKRKQAQWAQWEQEAQAGDEEAAYKLLMLYYGTEVEGMLKEEYSCRHALAFKWALAVAQNTQDPGVLLQVGEMYENGHGTPKDLHAALKWYENALTADTSLGAQSPLSQDGHLFLESRIIALRRELHPNT